MLTVRREYCTALCAVFSHVLEKAFYGVAIIACSPPPSETPTLAGGAGQCWVGVVVQRGRV